MIKGGEWGLPEGEQVLRAEQARKLQATLVPVRNYHRPTDSLTGGEV